MRPEYLGALAVGHEPSGKLAPADDALFKSFQSNLLSLISHELRTPLTGILNSLGLLEEGEGQTVGEFSEKALIRMARLNALRLHRALSSLLDVAAVESGTFHARLREVDLTKIVRGRYEAHRAEFRDQELEISLEEGSLRGVLADPQRLSRAIDLCLDAIVPRTEKGSKLQVRISSSGVGFEFTLAEGSVEHWQNAWSEARAGFEGGVGSPISAFAGVVQSEQAFLTRMEEGLGSELIIAHEIMRLHKGRIEQEQEGSKIKLLLVLPALSSEEGLRAVLNSRVYEVSTELKSVALVLLAVPKGQEVEAFTKKLKENLFRASDAVYPLPATKRVAIVLDDCKPEDGPKLVQRLRAAVPAISTVGIAHCPADGLDPSKLLEFAEARMKPAD